MIQDIFPYKLDNSYDPSAVPDKDSFFVCFRGSEIMVADKEELSFPQLEDICVESDYTYLFSIGEEKYFLLNSSTDIPEGFCYRNVSSALRGSNVSPKHRAFAGLTAKHLNDWYRDSGFCGRCGKKMIHSKKSRSMICECGYHNYPRIMPAVIVGVTNGDRILLTHYRTGFAHNALIAGFTEIGETLEETVQREVMEEAGIRVKNIRYYKTQPWGIANDILIGYYCDVDGDDEIHMDKNELATAIWTKREDIVLQPDDYSLTGEMMKMFKENRL